MQKKQYATTSDPAGTISFCMHAEQPARFKETAHNNKMQTEKRQFAKKMILQKLIGMRKGRRNKIPILKKKVT